MKDLRNHSLLTHNTFGINVKCRRFVEYSSIEEAQILAHSFTDKDKPLLIIGSGSNLLLTGDYAGTVIHSDIKGIEVLYEKQNEDKPDTVLVRCGAGENWDELVALCVEKRWYGTENLSLIPGEVGASAIQNIGAYGVEAKDLIVKVEAVEIDTGNVCEFSNSDCQYAYRYSRFKKEWRNKYLITYVTFRFSTVFNPILDYGNIRNVLKDKGIDMPTAEELRRTVIDIRREKLPDPEIEGNAGSFFMNPIVSREKFEELNAKHPDMPHYTIDSEHEKIPAGWMIEQCGWKGRSMGRAGVHSKQALVLVNRGGASGKEIVELCETIRCDVLNKFGIEILPEVNIV